MEVIYVTVFKDFYRDIEQLTLEEMLGRIKSGYYDYLIEPLRKLLNDSDREGYDKAKRMLLAFTPSAKFVGGRKMIYMLLYSRIIVLDIDKLSPEKLEQVKALICQSEYTLACFVSPSGNGLKVLVRVGSGPEGHLRAFLEVQRYFTVLTGVQIDPSGKDITRLCFVSSDRKLYYNRDARVFGTKNGDDPDKVDDKHEVEVPAKASREDNPTPQSQNYTQTYSRCISYVERFLPYVVGHRNEFVFRLSLKCRKEGLPEDITTNLMLNDYNYDEKEVRATVRSAYRFNLSEEPPFMRNPQSISTEPEPKPAGMKEVMKQPPHSVESADDATDHPADPPAKPKRKGYLKYDLRKVEARISSAHDFRYNVVNSQLEWRVAGTEQEFRRLTDYDENSIFRDLLLDGQDIPISILHAILMSDFTPDYNPFVDYFDGLEQWDGVTDYLGQLAATVKTMDDQDWDLCLRKWFVAFAVSLLVDDIINHTIIVLIGPQGVGKTRWSKSLLSEKLKAYLAPGAFSADNKDTQIMMSECGLIILDELENLNRKDLANFKELITRLFFKIRRPYGRIAISLVHRASCIASVNHNQILTDTSGSRRYLCHTVNEIDYEHDVDMDGCMAQALALYKSGFKYWFDTEDIKVLTGHNEAYMSKSVEEELIETWLRPVTAEEWNDRHKSVVPQDIRKLSATQIGMVLTEKAKIILIDSTVVKIGKIMNKLKYMRVRAGNTFAYYVRVVSQNTVEMNTRTTENADEVAIPSLNLNNLNKQEVDKDDELPF